MTVVLPRIDTDSVIALVPPSDGREWDCQCARCGSSCGFDDCWECNGVAYEEWAEQCRECDGRGGYEVCLSSPAVAANLAAASAIVEAADDEEAIYR